MSPTQLQPDTLGYMYAPNHMSATEVDRRASELTEYARNGGYGLTTVYYEWDAHLKPALTELIAELQRIDGRYVIVRSLQEFSQNSVLQEAICERVLALTKATVIVMDES